jgi:hypothetical protein
MHEQRLKSGARITGEDATVLAEVAAQIDRAHVRDERKRALWGSDMEQAMTRLCQSFPSLARIDCIDPWDATALLRWLCTSGAVTGGSRHAAKFVLQVWNSGADWQAIARKQLNDEELTLEPFNVVHAFGVWDEAHAAAFRVWVELPFFP